MQDRLKIWERRVRLLLIVAVGASLLHYAHNGMFLSDYPNMPASLTPVKVYLAWLGVTAIALLGYLLLPGRWRAVGFLLLAVYGVLGLDGLAHYALAPLSAHSYAMNFTILFESSTAAALLAALTVLILESRKSKRHAHPI